MNLKSLVPAMSVLLAFSATLALLPASARPRRKPRVAVLDFDYATVQSSTSAMLGSNVNVGKGITDLLITGLVNRHLLGV